jgi:hypothetical protein
MPEIPFTETIAKHDKATETSKQVRNPNGMPVGPRYISIAYMHQLSRLPGIMIAPEHGDPDTAMPFVFTGGEGLLMPMRRP